MENDVLDALEDLCYTDAVDEDTLSAALRDGPASMLYTSIVAWLSGELKQLCHLNESISPVSEACESGTFLMELSGFLREYGCPYKSLNEGSLSERLQTKESRLQLLDYLFGEVMACRILQVNKPLVLKPITHTTSTEQPVEDDIATEMKNMLIALKIPKPPANITSFQIFSKVEAKVKELILSVPTHHLGQPLLKSRLSDTQWERLMRVSVALSQEYEVRREMLLKRLDVTIQSFLWSDRAKHKQDAIASVYRPIRTKMTKNSRMSISHILAARDDLMRLQKTSSGEARRNTKCDINKVMIGKVPDRGGRAWELEPPPPEMPGFQQRQAGPARPQSGRGGGQAERGGYSNRGGSSDRGSERGAYRGGSGERGGNGNRGGHGDSRGGRVLGGWSDSRQQNRDHGGNWNKGGGGYQSDQVGQGAMYSSGGYSGQGGNQQQGAYNGNQCYQGGNMTQSGGYEGNSGGRGSYRGRGRGGRGGY